MSDEEFKIYIELDNLIGNLFDDDRSKSDVLHLLVKRELENRVATAKLGIHKDSCKLEDVQWWEDVTHFYTLDTYWEPTFEVDHTDGDFKCYWCTGCEQSFDKLEEVKEHLNG